MLFAAQHPTHPHKRPNTRHTNNTPTQAYMVVGLGQKMDVLWGFIKTHLTAKTIVFLSTCKQVCGCHRCGGVHAPEAKAWHNTCPRVWTHACREGSQVSQTTRPCWATSLSFSHASVQTLGYALCHATSSGPNSLFPLPPYRHNDTIDTPLFTQTPWLCCAVCRCGLCMRRSAN